MNTFEQERVTEVKDFRSNFTEVTTFSKIVAAVVFVALPFIGFYMGTEYTDETPVIFNPPTSQLPSVEEIDVLFKKTHYLGGEVPASWSTYHAADVVVVDSWPPERPHAKAYLSMAVDDIVFYDWNANQIDVYILTSIASKEYVEYVAAMSQNDPEVVIEQENINGVNAYAVTWPLDNGEVTKVGSGGKDILIAAGTSTDSFSILISKQSLGDKSFEDAFSRFVGSIDVNKWDDPK